MKKGLFIRIISSGVNSGLSISEVKRIKLTNGIAFILGIGVLMIISFSIIFELFVSGNLDISLKPAIYTSFSVIIALSCIHLNKKGYYLLSRFILQVLFWIVVVLLSVVYGKSVRLDQYFLVLMLLPFGLFQRGIKITIAVAISIVLYIGCNIYYYFFPPIIEMSEKYSSVYFMIHTIMTIAMIIALIAYFRRQNENSEKALSDEIIKHVRTTEELHKANIAKDKFFSIIAHDLKGPIGNIANLLKNYNIEEVDPELLFHLRSSTQNTYELVQDLLTWARAQKEHFDIEPTNFNIYKNISKLVSVQQYSARQKNIDLVVSCEEKEIFVFADIPSIDTVLRNLIANAIKFTKEGGKIKVTASAVNGKLKITVSDTGVGMSVKKLPQLFKVGSNFSSPGTMNERGTGLGLLLCKEFVEQNKGEIGVESEPGKGSSFWFTLPLGKAIDLDKIQEIIKEKRLRTLIVEDNYLNMQNTITEIITLNINYDVAKNGEEAIEKGIRREYDFILMDIDLPKINGIEANKAIREKFPRAIIIALSSYDKTEILTKDVSVYFDEYLRKPLNVDNMLYALNKLILVTD